jgi:hypothetical protein
MLQATERNARIDCPVIPAFTGRCTTIARAQEISHRSRDRKSTTARKMLENSALRSRQPPRPPKIGRSHGPEDAGSASQVPGIIGTRGLPPNASSSRVLNPAGAAAAFLGAVPLNPRTFAPRSVAGVDGSESMYSWRRPSCLAFVRWRRRSGTRSSGCASARPRRCRAATMGITGMARSPAKPVKPARPPTTVGTTSEIVGWSAGAG